MLFTTSDPATAPMADQAFPLMRAVLDGLQPGMIWTGTQPSRRCALVANQAGFMQWLGAVDDHGFNGRVEAALSEGHVDLPNHVRWYTPPTHLRAWLSRRPGVLESERIRFRLEAPDPGVSVLPDGLRLQPLAAQHLAATAALGLHVGSRFWPSAHAALTYGMGVGVVDAQDRLLACAYAACVVNGLAELEIAVNPAQRGRGLGLSVGRALMKACRSKGVRPSWDCFATNDAGVRLAARLGFTPARRYAMLSFGVPLESASEAQETGFGGGA